MKLDISIIGDKLVMSELIKFLDNIGLDFVKHFSKVSGLNVCHKTINEDKQMDPYIRIEIHCPADHIGWGWSIVISDNQFLLSCGNFLREYALSDPYSIPNMKQAIMCDYIAHKKYIAHAKQSWVHSMTTSWREK